jgi:hypothetical protein
MAIHVPSKRRFTRFEWMTCVAVMAVLRIGASPGFAQGAPGNDIPSFVACLNKVLDPNVKANVADAVQCLPDGCKLTVTMSNWSAQEACFADPAARPALGQLPRVVLSCPGPTLTPWQRFRPSFLLCPTGSEGADGVLGANRVEIGADQQPKIVSKKAAVNMEMADVPIGGKFWNPKTDFRTMLSIINAVPGAPPATKNCNSGCHVQPPLGGDPIMFNGHRTTTINSLVIDPFGSFAAKRNVPNVIVDLQRFIIDTTEPNKTPLVNPTASGTKKQDLIGVCDDQDNKRVGMNQNLCNNLRDYQDGFFQRSDGTFAKPCRPSLDPKVVPVCGGINGGGMFNDNLVASVISIDVSGQAKNNNDGTFTFLDTDGTLTAYNYGTRTMLTSVAITVLRVLNFGTTVSGQGLGQLSVNGKDPEAVGFKFNIDNINKQGADLTFKIVAAAPPGLTSIGGTAARTPPGTKVKFSGGFNFN